jgi:hypothetical protein
MSLTADVVIAKYIALRDKRSELKKEYVKQDAPYVAAMDKIEAWLLAQCNALGTTGFSVKGLGTATKGKSMSVSCKDWAAFESFVKEQNQLAMFERRIARSVLQAYMDAHNSEIPPGLDVMFEQTMTVSRAPQQHKELAE